MSKIIVHRERCKNCMLCIEVCPKKALSVSDYTNEKSYQATTVDEEACIACGTCFIICPDYVFEIPKGE